MASLDYKKYVPAKLDIVYDRQIESVNEQITTPTPSSEDLDQELEDLLLLMGGDCVTSQVVEPSAVPTRRLNPDELKPRRLNYQVPTYTHNKYDKELPTDSSNRFDYPADARDSSNRLNSALSSTNRYNYQPTDSNSYSYQVDKAKGKFNYQSDRTESKFNNQISPHRNTDRFDYQPSSSKFDHSIPAANKFDSVPASSQNYSGSSGHDEAVLDVEVDQNTRVRLEVGVSAEVGNGTARASAYAKATIYRRG